MLVYKLICTLFGVTWRRAKCSMLCSFRVDYTASALERRYYCTVACSDAEVTSHGQLEYVLRVRAPPQAAPPAGGVAPAGLRAGHAQAKSSQSPAAMGESAG